MKKMILLAALLFTMYTNVGAQVYLTINNTTGCDIEVGVISKDGTCGIMTNFGRMTITAGSFIDFTQTTVPGDYEVWVYDPAGTLLVPNPLSVSNLCGMNNMQSSSTTFGCNGGNVITAQVTNPNPVPPPTWIIDIF